MLRWCYARVKKDLDSRIPPQNHQALLYPPMVPHTRADQVAAHTRVLPE